MTGCKRVHYKRIHQLPTYVNKVHEGLGNILGIYGLDERLAAIHKGEHWSSIGRFSDPVQEAIFRAEDGGWSDDNLLG
jgi:hypothetical protein